MSPRSLLALGAPVLSVVLLAGCGSDSGDTAADDTDTSSSTSTPTAEESYDGGFPTCEEVWQEGETLAEDYLGCMDGATPVDLDGIECESGQFIITFDDRFWAVADGPIAEADGALLDDADYQDVLASCRG
ncbi:hypothetical protein ASE01_23360 [Nocardioides sp. Root190]|uniref:hypothetical protein n=1 Tax=Nocardioides sp. Root190 TaxID=1736488 RepID=UPI0006FE7D6A|nr:hypothetical protein [Nocardioides sp. Root190]KRB79252.1 hypothetical protein ASE01_23360 [Nocardioides sp. Root190]